MIELKPCVKGHACGLDKAIEPAQTVINVRNRLKNIDLDILAETRRIDVGRLDIPVFMSICGADARKIMPARKQMGKGSSPEQAEASALMELVERFSFFSFWEDLPGAFSGTWSEAKARFGDDLLSVEEILFSVNDKLAPEAAEQILDLLTWQFFKTTNPADNSTKWLPLDWFKQLGEFNGTSAGNTDAESLLQGVCELVERHVCALIDAKRPELPTIDPSGIDDPVLHRLLEPFRRENITIVLKDFSQGMPVPTVGALAFDPSTLGRGSEIVFTAGTAANPLGAAVRAITEVAQLAGDFCTEACYEASGLPKIEKPEDISWLLSGSMVRLSSLPAIAHQDILQELRELCSALKGLGYNVYAVSTTHPKVRIPAHYAVVPGFAFRERDKNQSLGLFVGRMLAERVPLEEARAGLDLLEKFYPNGHFIPFFRGLTAMREGDMPRALDFLAQAEKVQPDSESEALAVFYSGYVHTLNQEWNKALPALTRAVGLNPQVREFWNLRGVSYFKVKNYEAAARDFERALKLDKGSAMDLANLGLCHKFMGNAAEARKFLTEALKIDPSLEFAEAHLKELEHVANAVSNML